MFYEATASIVVILALLDSWRLCILIIAVEVSCLEFKHVTANARHFVSYEVFIIVNEEEIKVVFELHDLQS